MIFFNCHLQTNVKGKSISVLQRNADTTDKRYKQLRSAGQQNIKLFVEISFMLTAWNNVCRFASSATVYRTMMMTMTKKMMKQTMKKMTMMSCCSSHRDNHSCNRRYSLYSKSKYDHGENWSAYSNNNHNSNSHVNLNNDYGENC